MNEDVTLKTVTMEEMERHGQDCPDCCMQIVQARLHGHKLALVMAFSRFDYHMQHGTNEAMEPKTMPYNEALEFLGVK
jgi:hypothetical protein